MAREFMPKSSALMPYIVVNRDAAVAGVFTIDGEAGSVDLTGKYVQITDYDQRVGSLEARVTTNTGDITDLKTAVTSINGNIGTINTSLSNKAAKGVNSDITGLTALSGPLRLGGDGVNSGDAVTLQQLTSSVGVITSTSNTSVYKVGNLIIQDFLVTLAAVGNFNKETLGGIDYYTHYYKVNLPTALTTGIIASSASVVGSTFGTQVAGVLADVKTRRDNDSGSSVSTTTLTISIKTNQIGWSPTLNIHVVGR